MSGMDEPLADDHAETTGQAEPEAKPEAEPEAEADELVRQERHPCDGPAELDVTIGPGRVSIRLAEVDEVQVEVRHEPGLAGGWTEGLTGLISWIGEATAYTGIELSTTELGAEAVRATTITWSEVGRRLVVQGPVDQPLRSVPLSVSISAPQGSRVAVRTGSADVTVTGPAGTTTVRTGSGKVSVERVDGDADVTTGSGGADLGPVSGRTRVKTGSGRLVVASLGGSADVKAGSGSIQLGEVHSDLRVHTGSGDVTVADAHAGRLDITAGSGDLRIGVHPGVAAELDVVSGSGRARSELDVATEPPPGGSPPLTVRGRTGSGNVLVTRA